MVKFWVILLFLLYVQTTDSSNFGSVSRPRRRIIQSVLKFRIQGFLQYSFICKNIKAYCDDFYLKGWVRYTTDLQNSYINGEVIGVRKYLKAMKYWMIKKSNTSIRLSKTKINKIIVNIEDIRTEKIPDQFSILEDTTGINPYQKNKFTKAFYDAGYAKDTIPKSGTSYYKDMQKH